MSHDITQAAQQATSLPFPAEGVVKMCSEYVFYANFARSLPHASLKVDKGGEDAVLISDVGAGVICVADGVSG